MTTIIISRNLLLGALNRLRHATGRDQVLPILSDLLFETGDTSLTVTAYNGSLKMSETVPLPEEVTHDGTPRTRFCVEARTLRRVLASLEEQPLSMEVLGYQVRVQHVSGSFLLPIEDANEYPSSFPSVTDGGTDPRHLRLESPGLARWIGLLYGSMPRDELRPALNGILLEAGEDGRLTLAASDGHQLVRLRTAVKTGGDPARFVIPRKVVDILRRILPKTGRADFYFKEYGDGQRAVGQFSVEVDHDENRWVSLAFYGIDGRYPNYNSVIPASHNICVTVDRRGLVRSIDRLTLFANCSSLLGVFRVTASRLEMKADDTDFGLSGEEHVDCETTGCPLPLSFCLQLPRVVSLLRRLTAGKVKMKLVDQTRPVILEPEPQPDVEEVTMLLMPMLLSD